MSFFWLLLEIAGAVKYTAQPMVICGWIYSVVSLKKLMFSCEMETDNLI